MAQGERFRRQFPRRDFNRKVGVLFRGEYFVTEAYELGEGGIGFYTAENLTQEQKVIVSFQIPHGEFVCVRGTIRFIEQAEDQQKTLYGVSFDNINFSHRRQIRGYVSARQPN